MQSSLKWVIFLLIFLGAFCFTRAEEEKPILQVFSQFLNNTLQWRIRQKAESREPRLKLTGPVILAGFLCFVASSISSAGGIGGGGLFIPILTIVAGLDLKTASSFSAFMVTGGSIPNVVSNMFIKSNKNGDNTLIDYDIALLSEPCMLLGVSIGVICNVMFPEWLITITFAVFLAWSTFKTFKSGISYWKLESQGISRNGLQKLENGLAENGRNSEGVREPLLHKGTRYKLDIPWMKLGVLTIIWFSFFVLYLLRGNRNGQELGDSNKSQGPAKLLFPVMAFLAGALGGIFGIGGGMLISPLLLQVGITPEVTAATCSFMVFFSSTMSAFQYVLLGMNHILGAINFSIICFVGSVIGLVILQRAVEKHGRASLIVFSVGLVLALSTVLMTSFGAVDVWRDYSKGRYMGFKQPC